MDYAVTLPSKPRVVSEDGSMGTYEIDGLFPGYGHTLGNSLRRIILSSLPGAAITEVNIDGVTHEFSTIAGVQEDVVTILLNLKKVRLALRTDEPQTLTISVKGTGEVKASDIKAGSQVEVLTPDMHIATLTEKGASLSMEMRVEQGLGFVPRERHTSEKVDIGTIALDALFSPIRRVNYEVENMRVGDRTDYNRLRVVLETDGTLTAREALERSIEIMIRQLKAIVGFSEHEEESVAGTDDIHEDTHARSDERPHSTKGKERTDVDAEVLKTRVETLGLSTRTLGALEGANVRTLGGLARKREEDILALEGIGMKGLQEIKRMLAEKGVTLK